MICARCRQPIGRQDTTGESQLYCPGSQHGYILCEPCFFEEETEVDKEGTNNLPETLVKYYDNRGQDQ